MRFPSRSSLMVLILLLVVTPVLGAACSRTEAGMPIVLFTDFGSEDYRVSQVKGIIYSHNTEARVIDGSHDVPAFDIAGGAFMLDIAAREFPPNTVFVAIIAPYAQEETRYLVLTTNKDQIFVLPDNGLLTYVVDSMGIKSVYQVNNQDLFPSPIEQMAAERIQSRIGVLIAAGYRAEDVGTPLDEPRMLDTQAPAIAGDSLLGTVVHLDQFGNCMTNIAGDLAGEFGIEPGETISVQVAGADISLMFGRIYSDVSVEEDIVFVNNNVDLLQLSVNLGNFAGTHGVEVGARVEISRLP